MTSDQVLVGKLGQVISGIRGGDRPGEVRVIVEGLPHCLIAYCKQAVPIGTQILVINARGARQVDVELWDLSRFEGI